MDAISNMQLCKFIGSDLSGLILKNNNIYKCDFSGSDLGGSHIQRDPISPTVCLRGVN
ncbi:MAG: pentapeptide repeat-containing protein [Bacteroidales bacterium]|nr:pentapeptide repeat-containing protein [Bacteroidales bacterium]